MVHKKKEQLHTYDKLNYKANQVPQWYGLKRELDDPEPSEREIMKRRAQSLQQYTREQLLSALNDGLKSCLRSKVRRCLQQNGSLENLKKDCLNKQRIDREVIPTAEDKAGIRRGAITNYLRHQRDKKNITFWQDVVHDHFDEIVLACNTEMEQPQLAQADIVDAENENMNSDVQDTEDTNDATDATDATTDANNESDGMIRTCSTMLSRIIRSDLLRDMQEWIENNLRNTMYESSDSAIDIAYTFHDISRSHYTKRPVCPSKRCRVW